MLFGGKFLYYQTDHESLNFLGEQQLHTQLQRKGVTKLLGLDYSIQYRKGKENKVADALSRREDKGECQAVSVLAPNWINEVSHSYEGTPWAQELITSLAIDRGEQRGYTLKAGLLRYRGRVVIGEDPDLRTRILQALHASPHGGHSDLQCNLQQGKAIVLLLLILINHMSPS